MMVDIGHVLNLAAGAAALILAIWVFVMACMEEYGKVNGPVLFGASAIYFLTFCIMLK